MSDEEPKRAMKVEVDMTGKTPSATLTINKLKLSLQTVTAIMELIKGDPSYTEPKP